MCIDLEVTRSKLELYFQFFIFILMALIMYFHLNLAFDIAFLIGLICVFIRHRYNKKAIQMLLQLDDNLWTVKYLDQNIKRITLLSVINHGFYIIFLTDKNNILIWHDQVSKKTWKQLQVLSLLFSHTVNKKNKVIFF